jgi:hypothetical protein
MIQWLHVALRLNPKLAKQVLSDPDLAQQRKQKLADMLKKFYDTRVQALL